MDNSTSMRNDLIQLVHDGMRVIDAEGEQIGRVEYVKMGDPEAATTRGNESHPGEPVFSDEDEPQVPEPLRADLLRNGFVKVDGGGFFFDQDYYLRADVIAAVEGDVVRLRLPKARLLPEDDVAAEQAHQGSPRVVPPAAVGLAFRSGSGSGTAGTT